jgi:hypothetical protein
MLSSPSVPAAQSKFGLVYLLDSFLPPHFFSIHPTTNSVGLALLYNSARLPDTTFLCLIWFKRKIPRPGISFW